MADLALRLKVFIASPSDVLPERDVAEQALRDCQSIYAPERILIETYRWEGHVPPTYRRVQPVISTQLRTAELTIAIIWSTLGSAARTGMTGTVEEVTIAGERVLHGYSDDILLYFKTAPSDGNPQATPEHVQAFKRRLRDTSDVFAGEFHDTDEFANRIRRDLRLWLDRWKGAPQLCAYALAKTPGGAVPTRVLGENRLAHLKQAFDPLGFPDASRQLGAATVRAYQEHGPEAFASGLAKSVAVALNPPQRALALVKGLSPARAVVQPFIDAGVLQLHDGSMRFTHEEWFYFFCAHGLLDAIENGDVTITERRPFVNPVHQYLSALCVGARRKRIVDILRGWLVNRDGLTEGKPICRNFAAYVLGMLNAIEAQEDLARLIDEDAGEDVRTYCVLSLGRMRARVQMPVLIELFERTDNADLRLMIAQAVSRMIGVADYPL